MKKRKFITAVFTALIPAMLACMPASCENAAKNTAVLILSDNREITIMAETEDGSAITVEGCTETALASSRDRNNKTVLHARGEKVVLKGKIIKLDCSGNNLTELNVKGLTSLQELLCNDNQLTELNVQGLPLQVLSCGFNQLTELNVQGLPLQVLSCGGNQLTELNVQGLPLQGLWCGGNQLTELNVQDLPLQMLLCRSNQLTELNVQGLTSLHELDCGDNQLTELNVQDLPLQGLWCGFNQLTELNVQGCTSLQELLCGFNQLTELNVQGCTSLQKLDCGDNQLNKEAFTKLFKDLSDRSGKDIGECILYTEKIGKTEGNYRNFTAEELKVIKDKNWLPSYTNSSLRSVEIQ